MSWRRRAVSGSVRLEKLPSGAVTNFDGSGTSGVQLRQPGTPRGRGPGLRLRTWSSPRIVCGNGKPLPSFARTSQRFIRTMLNGWAYGAIYGSSQERTRALDGWLWHYNHQRRHSALGHQPPVSRTNLLGSYI